MIDYYIVKAISPSYHPKIIGKESPAILMDTGHKELLFPLRS